MLSCFDYFILFCFFFVVFFKRANVRVRISTTTLIYLGLGLSVDVLLIVKIPCGVFCICISAKLFVSELLNRFQKTCTIFGYKRFYLFIATSPNRLYIMRIFLGRRFFCCFSILHLTAYFYHSFAI